MCVFARRLCQVVTTPSLNVTTRVKPSVFCPRKTGEQKNLKICKNTHKFHEKVSNFFRNANKMSWNWRHFWDPTRAQNGIIYVQTSYLNSSIQHARRLAFFIINFRLEMAYNQQEIISSFCSLSYRRERRESSRKVESHFLTSRAYSTIVPLCQSQWVGKSSEQRIQTHQEVSRPGPQTNTQWENYS